MRDRTDQKKLPALDTSHTVILAIASVFLYLFHMWKYTNLDKIPYSLLFYGLTSFLLSLKKVFAISSMFFVYGFANVNCFPFEKLRP